MLSLASVVNEVKEQNSHQSVSQLTLRVPNSLDDRRRCGPDKRREEEILWLPGNHVRALDAQ